jgi:hypothetical protein
MAAPLGWQKWPDQIPFLIRQIASAHHRFPQKEALNQTSTPLGIPFVNMS